MMGTTAFACLSYFGAPNPSSVVARLKVLPDRLPSLIVLRRMNPLHGSVDESGNESPVFE